MKDVPGLGRETALRTDTPALPASGPRGWPQKSNTRLALQTKARPGKTIFHAAALWRLSESPWKDLH